VLLGVFLGDWYRVSGVRSLSFAVGRTFRSRRRWRWFAGGLLRWLVERGAEKKSGAESEVSPGSLYSSGLIAAGGVIGLLSIVIKVLEGRGVDEAGPRSNVGTQWIGSLATNGWMGVVMFLLLAFDVVCVCAEETGVGIVQKCEALVCVSVSEDPISRDSDKIPGLTLHVPFLHT